MGAPDMIVNGTAAGGPPIGGIGTPNTIPRWTGPSTLGDSGLIDNGTAIYTTARNFGIGTASPVNHGAGAVTLAVNGTSLSMMDWMVNGTRTMAGFAQAVISQFGTVTSSPLAFLTANTERARIDSSGNVGIGTASPAFRLHVAQTSGYTQVRAQSTDTAGGARFQIQNDQDTTQFASYGSAVAGTIWGIPIAGLTALFTGNASTAGLAIGTGGAYPLYFATNSTERARIDSAGRLLVGTTGTPSSAAVRVVVAAASGGQQWHSQGLGGCALVASVNTAQWYVYPGANVGSEGYLTSVKLTETGLDVTTASATPGIKLPNAPTNTDPNTLDSYREGTRVLAAGDLSGWTYVTATQYWTLVGRTVTLHTIFTGGTSSATGGATIATPPLLTPLRIAAGAAVNSSGTALGNGVCVVASTSSTTGTVITSNAISSSAVDKVLTVTYETAGL